MDTTLPKSCQWVALQMLRYLGVTSFSLRPDPPNANDNKTYLSEGLLENLAGIMSAALQAIFRDAPAAVSEVPGGLSAFAPAQVTLNVVHGQAATTLAGGWQDWMNGCAVLIVGDGFVNEWINRTGLLRRPYLGPTANGVQATVFCTAIEVPSDVRRIIEPVHVGGCPEALYPCADRAEYDRRSGCRFGEPCGSARFGWPSAYFVETIYSDDAAGFVRFLRLAPASQANLPVTFRYRMGPPTITADDLGNEDNDPGVIAPVPDNDVESIFLPYCLQMLTAHELFKNEAAKPEIARQFQAAQAAVKHYRVSAFRQRGNYAFTC